MKAPKKNHDVQAIALPDDPYSDKEYLPCLEYVIAVELGNPERMSLQDYAEYKSIHLQTLYLWRKRWDDSGLMRAVREEVGTSVHAAYEAINRKALRYWPRLLDTWIHISLNSPSDFNRINAVKSLYEQVIAPTIQSLERPGNEEQAYLTQVRAGMSLDPMAVVEGSASQRPYSPSGEEALGIDTDPLDSDDLPDSPEAPEIVPPPDTPSEGPAAAP